MDRYDEQSLREEVLYLHALWRQGPPSNSSTNKRARPMNQCPSINKKTAPSGSDPPAQPDTGPEWPVNPTASDPPSSGWPEFKQEREKPVSLLSLEEKAKASSITMHRKVIEACREYFIKRVPQESSEDEEEEEDDDDDEDGVADGDGLDENYKFFLDIFVNNNELRSYYEKNYENGVFCCLVCGGICEKVTKKFKDCVGLLQHSIAISKTKNKKAHRAFGRVICEVLGWNFDRLPVIVLKGEPLGRSLANSSVSQNNDSESNVDKSIVAMESVDGNSVDSVDKENSLKEDDVNHHVENVETQVSDMESIPKKGVNCLGSGPSQCTSVEWPCIKLAKSTGWSPFESETSPKTQEASAEEQVRLAMVQMQQKVFEPCRQFFAITIGSDSDEDDNGDENENEDEADNGNEDGSQESKGFKFFLCLFTENIELRNYYENNSGGGDFCCLVCGAIGKKVWRRFKDCVGLLQHCTSISNTKKRQAHRSLGQVICRVLGWDFDRLPTIVLKDEPLSHSLRTLGMTEHQHDGDVASNKNGLGSPKRNAESESTLKEELNADKKTGMRNIGESSSNEDPCQQSDLEDGTLNMSPNEGRAVNSLNDSGEDGTNLK